MRYIITTFFLLFSLSIFAQVDAGLKKAMSNLNIAMLKRDTVAIKKLVDDKIKYGHSNGMVQSGQEIMDDMYNGKLLYTDIKQTDVEVQKEGDIVLVRSKMLIDVAMNSKPAEFNLSVLQVWMKKKTGWVLIARQSGKM